MAALTMASTVNRATTKRVNILISLKLLYAALPGSCYTRKPFDCKTLKLVKNNSELKVFTLYFSCLQVLDVWVASREEGLMTD